MAAAAETPLARPASPEVFRLWLRHLTSLYVPGVSLLFLATGPHPWYLAIAWMWPLVVAHQLDCAPRFERAQPHEALPALPFDLLVYLLAALQFVLVGWTVLLFTEQSLFSMDMVMVFLLIGGSSGFSIITAHELIHRRNRGEQWLGRLLLCTVLYEHFYTEHLRGHHVRVGTPDDPATARFGEGYEGFFRRTVPAQLRSAWRLEKRRLGDEAMGLLDRRMLGNRVLHGLVLEWGLALAILGFLGVAPFVAFLLQALMAVRLLEAVNYFEHWGLVRKGPRVRPRDSWDTHSWFTYYGLIGLSRHADHHAWPARPYQQLRVFPEAPILPAGYVGTIDLVMAKNREFQEYATRELGRRRLGPFASDDEAAPPVPEQEALARLDAAGGKPRAGSASPLRRLLVLGALVVGTAVLVHLESGAAALGLGGRIALHAWIAAALLGAGALSQRIRARWDHESFALGVAFGLLVVVGFATDALLGL